MILSHKRALWIPSTPGVLQVLDPIPPRFAPRPSSHAHLDDVEPKDIPGPSVPLPPDLRNPGDGPTLPPDDTLGRRPPLPRRPRLHLDERHQRPPSGHQIQLLMPQPETVGLDGPAAAHEIGHGHPLTPETAALARVLPLAARNQPGP